MFYCTYETLIGKIGISSDGEAVTGLSFSAHGVKEENSPDALTDKAAKQLQEYLEGKRKSFDLPLSPKGTEFQQAVWKCLTLIPYGETRTYKQLAEAVGRPSACRAVGMANNKNPIAVIIPCHRVIGSNGRLVGYAGGLDIKEKLLRLEKQH